MIVRLIALDMVQMEPLVSESQHEGFQFLARLCEEWASGTNRFSLRGEALLVCSTPVPLSALAASIARMITRDVFVVSISRHGIVVEDGAGVWWIIS